MKNREIGKTGARAHRGHALRTKSVVSTRSFQPTGELTPGKRPRGKRNHSTGEETHTKMKHPCQGVTRTRRLDIKKSKQEATVNCHPRDTGTFSRNKMSLRLSDLGIILFIYYDWKDCSAPIFGGLETLRPDNHHGH